MSDALTFPSEAETEPLDVALSTAVGEIAALKRAPASGSHHRSMADEGFRRSWARLLAGEAPEDVAATEVAFAAAHIALGPVDASRLAEAGVDATDRRFVYTAAAERTLGALPGPIAAALEGVAEGLEPVGGGAYFVELLAGQARAGAISEGAARLVQPPEEMQSEHAWCVAVIGGLFEVRRGREPTSALLLGLSHHLRDAYRDPSRPDADGSGAARSEARALEECPGDLAERLAAHLTRREETALAPVAAFLAADLIDRVLQQRHYANLAGFSLSDAMDTREFVGEGPLRTFQLEVLQRFRLTF